MAKKTVSQMRTEAREAFMKEIMEYFESIECSTQWRYHDVYHHTWRR